jgi:hypothetical protein
MENMENAFFGWFELPAVLPLHLLLLLWPCVSDEFELPGSLGQHRKLLWQQAFLWKFMP